MAAESFFDRWSKRKAETATDAPDAAATPVPDDQPEKPIPPVSQPLPPPTIEEVANLTQQSDYSRFIGKGVDDNIQRAALKKLFADPHFNIMDGLDTYIEDYNKFDPIPPEMLALLNHAKGLLDPLSQFEKPMMRLMEKVISPEPSDEQAAPDESAADIESASAEPDAPEPQGDTTQSAPDDGTLIEAITKPDDDHKIQSM